MRTPSTCVSDMSTKSEYQKDKTRIDKETNVRFFSVRFFSLDPTYGNIYCKNIESQQVIFGSVSKSEIKMNVE